MSAIEITKLATYTGHRDCIYTIVKGEEFNLFFTASGDGMVVKWDLKNPDNGELFAKVSNSVYAMLIDTEANNLIVAENFMGIHLINLKDKKQEKALKITDAAIFDLKIFRNLLFVACGDGEVVILNLNDFTIIKRLKFSEQSARCIEVTENELIVGYSDHLIRIFDLDYFNLLKTVTEHSNSVFTLAYNSQHNYIISAGRDAQLKVWNSKFELKESVVAHMFAINHICFSPDGKYFATCSMDKSIKVWDSSSFQLLKVIDKSRHAGHGTSINKLMWTTFEDTLVSVSDDRTISVWKLDFKIKNIK